MNKTIQSRKYAQALLDSAGQNQVLDEVYSQLETLHTILRQVSALKAILITSRVSFEQKQVLLDLKKADQLYHEKQNSIRVTATSSVELSPAQIHDITQRVVKAYGKNPEFETVVDPSIIGGLRLRVGNTVIDGSLTTRLGQLKKNLSQS